MMNQNEKILLFPFVMITLALLIAGCSLPAVAPTPTVVVAVAEVAPSVAIIQPSNGAQVHIGEQIDIRVAVADAGGASTLMLESNGVLERNYTFHNPLKLGSVHIPWKAPQAGAYTLRAYLATSRGDTIASEPVTINAAGELTPTITETATATVTSTITTTLTPSLTSTSTSTPTTTFTPTITLTWTITPSRTLGPPMATANSDTYCFFGPGGGYDIASTLYQGQTAPIIGRNEEYTWWLIQDVNSPAQCWVANTEVTTSGDISRVPVVQAPPTSTPTPTATQPPVPAPRPISPSGTVDCTKYVTLRWEAVSHPNGIDHYEWVLVGPRGSQSSGSTRVTSVDVPVTCGGATYTWRVRAVDGKGNIGTYSNDMQFTVVYIVK